MIISFGDNIYNGKISIDEAEMNKGNLLENMLQFKNEARPKKEDKEKKAIFLIV